MKFIKKKSIVILATLTMASSALPVQAASQYSNIEQRFAKSEIQTGIDNGSINGYPHRSGAEVVFTSNNAFKNDKLSKPSKPQGITGAVDNGGNANDSILMNIAATNPFINILDGFDQIWSMNQQDWRDGTALNKPGANGEIAKYGDGPTVYFDGYKMDKTKVVADEKTYATKKSEMQRLGQLI